MYTTSKRRAGDAIGDIWCCVVDVDDVMIMMTDPEIEMMRNQRVNNLLVVVMLPRGEGEVR